MTREGFLRRLQGARPVHCTYQRGECAGLISAWAHGGRFVLTWEECPAGGQYDESTYTRDERREFATAEEVLAFVEEHGHPASAFGP
ncbi:MAG: hypothetical protein U0835_03235 [Isosphaeraceae bacterium]